MTLPCKMDLPLIHRHCDVCPPSTFAAFINPCRPALLLHCLNNKLFNLLLQWPHARLLCGLPIQPVGFGLCASCIWDYGNANSQ